MQGEVRLAAEEAEEVEVLQRPGKRQLVTAGLDRQVDLRREVCAGVDQRRVEDAGGIRVDHLAEDAVARGPVEVGVVVNRTIRAVTIRGVGARGRVDAQRDVRERGWHARQGEAEGQAARGYGDPLARVDRRTGWSTGRVRSSGDGDNGDITGSDIDSEPGDTR